MSEMDVLRVVFWNVQDLFEVGHERGDPTAAALNSRVKAIAKVLTDAFDGEQPDLIGLAEVHTERILKLIAAALGGGYWVHFERCNDSKWTGLGILAREVAFREQTFDEAHRKSYWHMPRWVCARFRLASGDPFLFIVNHWPSRVGKNGEADRLEVARYLGKHLAASDTTCAIAIGDFNAEPFEAPFAAPYLETDRHFPSGAYGSPSPLPLYNTAWRFLAEPDHWESVRNASPYVATRPRTTITPLAPLRRSVIFDQLLVSRAALKGGPISLGEKSMTYFTKTLEFRVGGYAEPRGWSDHFPLAAVFKVT